MDVTDAGLKVVELADGVTLEELQSKTGVKLI
jgi:3-oxoacid CoA-transferase subunit B